MDPFPRVAESYVPAGIRARVFASSEGEGGLHGYEWRGRFWIVPGADKEGRRYWAVCNAETGGVVSWNYSMPRALALAGWLVTPRTAGRES
jgi:hypothetical protein